MEKLSTMKILALERELPGAAPARYEAHAKDEARTVWELYQRGIIREPYFDADHHTAVLMLECASSRDAAAALAELPFVRESLISFDLIPLVAYNGFARLFASDAGKGAEK